MGNNLDPRIQRDKESSRSYGTIGTRLPVWLVDLLRQVETAFLNLIVRVIKFCRRAGRPGVKVMGSNPNQDRFVLKYFVILSLLSLFVVRQGLFQNTYLDKQMKYKEKKTLLSQKGD